MAVDSDDNFSVGVLQLSVMNLYQHLLTVYEHLKFKKFNPFTGLSTYC